MRLTNTHRLLASVALRVSQEQLDTLLSLSTLPEGVKCRINSPIKFLTVLRQNCGTVADFVQKLDEMLSTRTSFADLHAVGRRLYGQCKEEDLSTKVTQSRLPMGLAEFKPRPKQSATFNSILLQISDCIPQHILEIMITVTPIPDGTKGRIRHSHGLFSQMKQCGCISENDTEFLEDLMREVNVIDALKILEGYKKLFPPIEFPPYTPQRHISTSSTPFSSLPARHAHTQRGGMGVQPESMPELGTPYVVGNSGYIRSASSNYPSSISSGNSNSTLSTYPGSMPSENSSSMSSGGDRMCNSSQASLAGLNSMPRSSMAPLSSNRFPQQPESSSNTGLRATPASPPCLSTPPVRSKNPVHFIKSISSPGSLPPISYPPSGSVPGQVGQIAIPHDDIFAGPRVYLPLETTPQLSQHAALEEVGSGSHDPTPSAPSLEPPSKSHDLRSVNRQGSSTPSRREPGGVVGGRAAEPWSEAASIHSQKSYISSNMNSGLAVGEEVSQQQQQPGTGAAGHTPRATGHTPHADPRSAASLESYSAVNSFPASEDVSQEQRPRTRATGHTPHAAGHNPHAAGHTLSSNIRRPQSFLHDIFQPPSSNPQFQPSNPQHLSGAGLVQSVGVQDVQGSRLVTEIGPAVAAFQANVEQAPSSSIVRHSTGVVINGYGPAHQLPAVQQVSNGNQCVDQNGNAAHWNGNEPIICAGMTTPCPVLVKRQISVVGRVSEEFNSINLPAVTTGEHAHSRPAATPIQHHSAELRPAATPIQHHSAELRPAATPIQHHSAELRPAATPIQHHSAEPRPAATPIQHRKSKRRVVVEKRESARHGNPEPPVHQSCTEEGEGHPSHLSESGEKVAQCNDTHPSPVVVGSGHLYPALPAQHNSSSSSEGEGEELVGSKRKRPHPQQVSREAKKQRKGGSRWSIKKPFTMVMNFIRGNGNIVDDLTDTGEAGNPTSACTETDDDEYHSCDEDKEGEEEGEGEGREEEEEEEGRKEEEEEGED